jgi:hypothetical protein
VNVTTKQPGQDGPAGAIYGDVTIQPNANINDGTALNDDIADGGVRAGGAGSLPSMNAGLPQDVTWHGRTAPTAVRRKPVACPRMVRRPNIDGDGQGDLAAAPQHLSELIAPYIHAVAEDTGDRRPPAEAP